MNTDQEQFLRDEIFSLTLMATVQRARVYKPAASERNRRAFHTALRSKLEEVAEHYETAVDEEKHIRNIVELSNSLSRVHKAALNAGRFRIGTAQKALNLYLKYLWCFGKIARPPHCPIDFQIIGRLPKYKGPKWTELDLEEDYRNLVAAAESKAGGTPLAVWELQAHNNAQPRTAAEVPQTAPRCARTLGGSDADLNTEQLRTTRRMR